MIPKVDLPPSAERESTRSSTRTHVHSHQEGPSNEAQCVCKLLPWRVIKRGPATLLLFFLLSFTDRGRALTMAIKKKVVTRLSMIFLKVIFANGAIHLYTCLILQPIMPCCICFLYYVWYFPFWRKLMLDSSSNSSYMQSSFPNKFSHLKLSFFDLAFMPSLHVSLIKAVMRGSVVVHFLHNFQNVFLGIPTIFVNSTVGLTKSIGITSSVP